MPWTQHCLAVAVQGSCTVSTGRRGGVPQYRNAAAAAGFGSDKYMVYHEMPICTRATACFGLMDTRTFRETPLRWRACAPSHHRTAMGFPFEPGPFGVCSTLPVRRSSRTRLPESIGHAIVTINPALCSFFTSLTVISACFTCVSSSENNFGESTKPSIIDLLVLETFSDSKALNTTRKGESYRGSVSVFEEAHGN